MPVPILLITGFLGAGKTTLINRLLAEPQGRRLAAVVNDFGAINIDAALLSSVSDDVISLKNGCICCSLLGDLLQTLSTVLRRDPRPDGIVIETSGVSNPAEIVRMLLDPVIWKEAALDTVICVVDAQGMTDRPSLVDDALWRSQVQAADFVALGKTDLVSEVERNFARLAIRRAKPDRAIHDMQAGRLPRELLLLSDLHGRQPATKATSVSNVDLPSFQSMSWTSEAPLVMAGFQLVVSRHAPVLIRAKGFVTFVERPDEPMLFQLVGTRAMLSRAPRNVPEPPAAQLVFLARHGTLDEAALLADLNQCRADQMG